MMRIKASNGMGVVVPALFTIPENPFWNAQAAGMGACGDPLDGLAGLACACGGKCGGYGSTCGCQGCGLGDLSGIGFNLSDYIPADVGGIPTTYLIGGAILAYLLLSRGSARDEYKAQKAAAKADYLAKLSDIGDTYAPRYKRYGRAAYGALSRG